MPRNHGKSKGRSNGERFVAIPSRVLEHSAVTTLDHVPFRVLVMLAAEFRGGNNGALSLTAAQAMAKGIGAKNSFYAALKELKSRGLIAETYPASRVPPRPAQFALEWRPLNDTEYTKRTVVASRGFESWQPEFDFRGATIATTVVNDCDHGSEPATHSRNHCDHGGHSDRSTVATIAHLYRSNHGGS